MDKTPSQQYFDYAIDIHSFPLTVDTSIHESLRDIPVWLVPKFAATALRSKLLNVGNAQVFYSDGSKSGTAAGFGIHNGQRGHSFKLSEPCSVFLTEVLAIFYCCQLIKQNVPSKYFICSDSMSVLSALNTNRFDVKASHFLLKIKEIVYNLSQAGYTIVFLWVPAHSSIYGNEEADALAKEGASNGPLYQREIQSREYFTQIKEYVRSEWQKTWCSDQMGRWCFSICPTVSWKPWFDDLSVSRNFIRNMSRIISNHYGCKSHLFRINILQENICTCDKAYEDIDHIVWSCERHNTKRNSLINWLRRDRMPIGVPIRDLLGSRNIPYLKHVNKFLLSIEQNI